MLYFIYTFIFFPQIIHFLKSHAHPELLKKSPVIPSTVSDQIRLWELERDRFKFSDGVLYNQFLSQADYELLRNYARVSLLFFTFFSDRLEIIIDALK